MAMTVIWTGMTALSLLCALAMGNQGELASAALDGAASAIELGISMGWQRLLPGFVLSRFSEGVFGFHGNCAYLPTKNGISEISPVFSLFAAVQHHPACRCSWAV